MAIVAATTAPEPHLPGILYLLQPLHLNHISLEYYTCCNHCTWATSAWNTILAATTAPEPHLPGILYLLQPLRLSHISLEYYTCCNHCTWATSSWNTILLSAWACSLLPDVIKQNMQWHSSSEDGPIWWTYVLTALDLHLENNFRIALTANPFFGLFTFHLLVINMRMPNSPYL